MVRRILWALLALTPIALLARYAFEIDETTLFIISALALIPLAWLIGEATEHAAQHTGPGVGGFLNASFGNAPELIIALFAVADNLPGVVRGSLTGSVVSNILLVLGAAMIAGGDGKVDTRSLRWQLAAVFGAVVLLLIPSIPAWRGGSPERHSLYLLSIPVSVVLLAAYVVDHGAQPAHPPGGRARGREQRGLVAEEGDRAARGRDARDGVRLGDPRALARPLRARGRPERVLHRGRDRRDRRERRRARRGRRDRTPWQHHARDGDRDHVVDAGGRVRHAGGLPALRASSAAGCRSRSG